MALALLEHLGVAQRAASDLQRLTLKGWAALRPVQPPSWMPWEHLGDLDQIRERLAQPG